MVSRNIGFLFWHYNVTFNTNYKGPHGYAHLKTLFSWSYCTSEHLPYANWSAQVHVKINTGKKQRVINNLYAAYLFEFDIMVECLYWRYNNFNSFGISTEKVVISVVQLVQDKTLGYMFAHILLRFSAFMVNSHLFSQPVNTQMSQLLHGWVFYISNEYSA